jgi:hypothetical protein
MLGKYRLTKRSKSLKYSRENRREKFGRVDPG